MAAVCGTWIAGFQPPALSDESGIASHDLDKGFKPGGWGMTFWRLWPVFLTAFCALLFITPYAQMHATLPFFLLIFFGSLVTPFLQKGGTFGRFGMLRLLGVALLLIALLAF